MVAHKLFAGIPSSASSLMEGTVGMMMLGYKMRLSCRYKGAIQKLLLMVEAF